MLLLPTANLRQERVARAATGIGEKKKHRLDAIEQILERR